MRVLLLCFAFACLHLSGQIVVRVDDRPAVTISAGDLAKLPRHSAVLNDHGKQISYEGELVHDVLALGGINFGSGLRGKQLSSYVAATANDGYEVVYSLAEFDPTITESNIIVADKRDGQPLAANEGPFRIIAPGDKRPARCVKMLRELDVIQLKR